VSDEKLFTIEIIDVNDAPLFMSPRRVIGWENANFSKRIIFNISGGINEPAPEKPTFKVVVSNPQLFTTQGQPVISSSGILTFTPTPGMFGETEANITMTDGQGTRNHG
jgi:hypothetical protein